ncbi:MAG: DUF4115 domain-containing protein [Candidatus Kapabacteria bacterium]|nr:DUF4115 domain-containing protein [Candidatus Kapabacteria bacterium]
MDPLAQRLREERERQQRSLRDLATETKIREPFLQALENADYAVLPTVYIKSFIRTYAAALGIPSTDLATLLSSSVETDDEGNEFFPQKSQRPNARSTPPPAPKERASVTAHDKNSTPKPSEQSNRSERTIVRLGDTSSRLLRAVPVPLLAAVGLAVLAGFVWLAVTLVNDSSEATGTSDSTTAVDVENAIVVADAAERDSIVLTAIATDTVWLTITTDGKGSQTLVMMPGNEGRWSAMSRFDVSIGNAGGLDLFRNGQQLAPLGKKGDLVRSAVITRTDVTTSSQAFSTPRPNGAAPSQERPSTTPAPSSPPAARQQQSRPRTQPASSRTRQLDAPQSKRRQTRPVPDITPPTRPPHR